MTPEPRRHCEPLLARLLCVAAGCALLFAACRAPQADRDAPDSVVERGPLTVEHYRSRAGLVHGAGRPSQYLLVIGDERHETPPGVPGAGIIFRCDLKPDSDEPIAWIAYYRPETAWYCGTRFGEVLAKCLPDRKWPVAGLAYVRDGRLAVEELGFWEQEFEWSATGIRMRDGRSFDPRTGSWSGCGDAPSRVERRGKLGVAYGIDCRGRPWQRFLDGDREIDCDEAPGRPFEQVTWSPNPDVACAVGTLGQVSFAVLSVRGTLRLEELGGNYPEFVDDGRALRWWSDDYQTRFTMDIATRAVRSVRRADIGSDPEL